MPSCRGHAAARGFIVWQITARDDRFARPLGHLPSEEREAVEHALEVADQTFARFEDDPSSHYYCAPGTTPEATWAAITHEVARVTGIALMEAARGGRLAVADFDRLHRGIFEPAFGSRTLSMRKYREQVEFGIVLGDHDNPEHRRTTGMSGKSLPRRLKELVKGLDAAFAERDRAVREGRSRALMSATIPAARAYGRLLAAHPWMDGNGRTAYPVLSFTLVRLGVPAVAVLESEDFHWCLGQAMQRRGRNVDPLAEYLAEIIRSSDTQ